MNKGLLDLFVTGGWVMWPLLIFSVLTWAIVIERAFVYLSVRPKLTRLAGAVLKSLAAGDVAGARQLCLGERGLISDIFLPTLDKRRSREHAARVAERNRTRFMGYLRRNLWILGTIGTASPFIGLLGTVLGILRAFSKMATEGTGGFSVVAGGISEALIATAAGLVVAIVALLFYNVFVNAANQTVSGLRLTLDEVLDQCFDPEAQKSPA